MNNFPLLVPTEEQERKLSEAREERRVEMALAKDTADLRGQAGSNCNSARSSVNNNASPSSRSTSPALEAETRGGQQGEEAKWELLGSRSYLYVDIEAHLLIPQLEITTQKQSQQQIILLREVVRQLKRFFNGRFDELFQEKEEAFEKISGLNERLDSVLAELRLEEEVVRPTWNSDEKPEMDLPEETKEPASVKVDGSLTSGRTSAGAAGGGESKDAMKKRGVMMGMETGSGKNTIPPPLFMKIKKPENFTDEEVAAAESYEAEVQRMVEKGNFRKRELEAEKNLLQVQIDEIVEDIDKKVHSQQIFSDKIMIFKGEGLVLVEDQRGEVRPLRAAENAHPEQVSTVCPL